MRTLILILVMNILIFGCSNNSDTQTTKIEFIEIAEGTLTGNGNEGIAKQNIVINNETDWNDLKTKMNTVNNETTNFTEQEIDFSKFLILAIFEDVKSTGGFHLSIIEIVKSSKNVFVKTKLNSPSDSNTFQIITQPYYIVKIPKNDLTVIFE